MAFVKEVKLAGSQRKVAVLTLLGFAMAAYPVWQHRNAPAEKRDAYAQAKKKSREDRIKWIESDEMPLK
jgi:hypothetical protein